MDKGVLLIGGITVVVLAIIIGITMADPSAKYAGKEAVGEEVALLEAKHIPDGSPQPEYNSNPPTSGSHYMQPAPWGIKTEQIQDETLVHNLEHGGVWITYNPQTASQEIVDKLTDIARGYRSKVVLSPRVQNDSVIALASWGKISKLDSVDETKIQEFIGRNKNKGPEQVPD